MNGVTLSATDADDNDDDAAPDADVYADDEVQAATPLHSLQSFPLLSLPTPLSICSSPPPFSLHPCYLLLLFPLCSCFHEDTALFYAVSLDCYTYAIFKEEEGKKNRVGNTGLQKNKAYSHFRHQQASAQLSAPQHIPRPPSSSNNRLGATFLSTGIISYFFFFPLQC